MGRGFGRLWAAYAVSTVGTWLAFDAFSLIAILALHAGPAAVSALAAVGTAAGAAVAIPLGPWMEFRRKRPVMIAADLLRFAALATVPLAYALGWLTFPQLLIVAVLDAAADIAFKSASGALLKWLVPSEHLLRANGRFESTQWTATALGPPLGGLAIGVLGPVATMLADAVSFLGSAGVLATIGAGEPRPARRAERPRPSELVEGWRYILSSSALRPLFLNNMAVSGLIMAPMPVLAVLMLGRLHFPAWQYGLAFAVPCVGGLVGSRLARPLARRFGQRRVLSLSGTLRVCPPLFLAFVGPGLPGLLLVMVVELLLIVNMGVFTPVLATYRLEHTPTDRVARVLSAWSISSSAAIAGLTALWGVLAATAGPRAAIALAGVLLLATPALLYRWAARTSPVS